MIISCRLPDSSLYTGLALKSVNGHWCIVTPVDKAIPIVLRNINRIMSAASINKDKSIKEITLADLSYNNVPHWVILLLARTANLIGKPIVLEVFEGSIRFTKDSVAWMEFGGEDHHKEFK